ncbi:MULTISPECIES: hypothetical protein [Methylorubrum]|uniref:Uncharacterized protein n=2 Tax=Bacteria TaxID=2 RepID=H1KUS1_METEX|nr:hypothetical protein [Methylorubrum extorquens]EHP80147.1 hypothetical protein MetexDRAFT_6384 [Methylorubrum extorquens DSM 13060]OAH19113.1 hypothetical protein AX289_30120 [Methylorubrum populi]
MPQIVLGEFREEVVRRAERTIHVVEEEAGVVELWHEGVLVDVLTTYTGLRYALEAAPEVVERLRIKPSSTLHVRVRAERTRGLRTGPGEMRYGRREYQEAVGPDWVAGRRHVWDSHAGLLPEGREVLVPFEISAFAATRDVRPELAALGRMTVRGVEHLPDELLWKGWGFGEVRDVVVDCTALDGRPGHIDRERGDEGLLWTRIRFAGAWVVAIPPVVEPEDVPETVSAGWTRPDITFSGEGWPDWTRSGRFYCGPPGAVHIWGRPTDRP